jgi:2-polyprenyl-3-methyl-5-hydroxy-6-metoxy-1,4-benzoquinol methylase
MARFGEFSAFDFEKDYPHFSRMIAIASTLNPLQKKRINLFVKNQNTEFWGESERIFDSLSKTFFADDKNRLRSAKAYNRMTIDFLKEQIRFKKSGKYLLSDASSAKENIYENPEIMRYYMVGLCMSYFLWPNHYKMYDFFQRFLSSGPNITKYLDVAPGHGLFAAEVLTKYLDATATIVDISSTSLEVSMELLGSFGVDSARYEALHGDFLETEIGSKDFDLITMGEVLEHVEDPLTFLKRAAELLGDNGRIFMTTCSNAPAIDHIYHFHNSEEIRDLIRDSGLIIEMEESIPAEDVPEEDCEKELVTVNYCCILRK